MVKINRTYSISEENVNNLKHKGNASELIDQLLTDYFSEEKSTDLNALENKKSELWKEKQILDLKISQIQKDITIVKEKQEKDSKRKELEEKLADFKREHEEFNKKFRNKEISEDEYWEGVEERKKKKEEILKDEQKN